MGLLGRKWGIGLRSLGGGSTKRVSEAGEVIVEKTQWPYVYRLVIRAEDGEEAEVSVGNAPEWIKWNRDLLDRVVSLALVPEVPFFPPVKVSIPAGAKWIYRRRTFACLAVGGENVGVGDSVTLHIIGWEKPLEKESMLLWIYSSGVIEVAEEPTLVVLKPQKEKGVE